MGKIIKFTLVLGLIAVVNLGVVLVGQCADPDTVSAGESPIGEIIESRTRTSKLYYLGDDKYAVDVSLGSVHYKDNPDDPGELWKNIDTAIVSSPKPNWNWEVVKGNWHLLIKNDTTIAIGKNGNWLGFQYKGFGYLDWATKDYHILQTRETVTPTIAGNRIIWENIFYETDLEYIYTPDGFKENLYISQIARDWLTANPPSSFGLNNDTSYLTGFIQCDWQSAFSAEDIFGVPVNWNNVNEFIDAGVFWRDPVKDKIITALPLGYAEHDAVNPEDWVKLRYRFYKHTDGNNYLLFGARVTDLNTYPDGTIVIDPTINQEITNDDYDGHADSGGSFSSTSNINGNAYDGDNIRAFYHFDDVTISNGSTIDTAYIRLYLYYINGNGGDCNIYGVDAEDPPLPEDKDDVWAFTWTTEYNTWNDMPDTDQYENSPTLVDVIQELADSYDYSAGDHALCILFVDAETGSTGDRTYAGDVPTSGYGPILYIEYTSGGGTPPTVTTNAATSVEDTTATLNGQVDAINDSDITERGFVWDTTSRGDPGDTAPGDSDYANYWTETGTFGTGSFSHGVTSLTTATTWYFRACAENDDGAWGYGSELSFLTKPAAPTNVAATDGVHTDKVVVTWTKSSGTVTGYKIYRDGGLIDTVGDVATYDDTGAAAPTITPGTATASDGSSTAHVTLSLSGESANNGASATYKVRAYNDSGDSDDSATDTGYRGVGSLTHQWQRSAADSDADYSNISGAITDPYDDTAAPAPTITPGTAYASDGSSTQHVTLTLSGESANAGDGRYYRCYLTATGASSQYSTTDRGYRGVGSLQYQWQRSLADSDADYSNISGATTDPYDDTGAPAPTITPGSATATDGSSSESVTLAVTGESPNNGDGRYYRCELTATGAASQTSTSDRGYRGVGSISYQWLASAGDVDEDYSNITGATTDPYLYTDAPDPTVTAGNATASDGTYQDYVMLTLTGENSTDGDGRYYKCELSMSGAASQTSTPDRGYKGTTALTYQWQRSAADSDADYSNISGAITDPYDDTDGVATPDGRYYQCIVGMIGAVSQNSTSDRGYKSASALPTVTASDATGITGTRATLNGNITATGGDNPTTRGFEWGYSSGNYSANWTDTGSFGTGTFSHAITGLPGNTHIFWRAFAINGVGRGNSTELDFWTLALPSAPTDFTVTQVLTNAFELTWAMGDAAELTIIRVHESRYPTDINDGILIYSGNGTSVDLDGINLDLHNYYYRAWSWNSYGYSTDYASASVLNPLGIVPIIFVIALCAFALWKRSYFRPIIAVAVIIWGVFAISYDAKIAVPLVVLGFSLFIIGIFELLPEETVERLRYRLRR